MPTGLTHGLVAIAGGKICFAAKLPKRFWVLAVICSAIPDLDTIGLQLGIPYKHFLGHRGFFHSLTFALILSLLVVVLGFRSAKVFSKRWWSLCAFFFFVTGSHGVLDAMTDGGLGIGLFAPFDNTRYFLPFRPLVVAPIGPGVLFTDWGLRWILRVLKSEILWIWIPAGLMWIGSKGIRALVSAIRKS